MNWNNMNILKWSHANSNQCHLYTMYTCIYSCIHTLINIYIYIYRFILLFKNNGTNGSPVNIVL